MNFQVLTGLFTALPCMQRGLSDEHLSVCLSNAWIVTKRKHLAKKVQLWLYRKSPTRFPISLRWTAYVAPNPPKGGLKDDNFFRFPYRKLDFPWRKSATKFLCVKTFSNKVVRHSLGYLTVHKWLVEDVTLNVKFVHSEPTVLTHRSARFLCDSSASRLNCYLL